MAFSDMFQELWGETAYQEFLAQADIASVCNRNYDGTISRRGDTVHVHFFDPSLLTVRTSWEPGAADTDFGDVKTINVDKERSIFVDIMDVDQLRTNARLQEETAFSAASRLANRADSDLILAVSGTGGIQSYAVGSSTPYDNLVDVRKAQAQDGYPIRDTWYFATATQYANLLKDDDVNRSTTVVSDQMVSGQVRRIAGVNVVEQSVDAGVGVFFHRNALAFVSQAALRFAIDSLVSQAKFGNRMGAGLLYGIGVLSTKGVRKVTNS